MCVSLFAWLFFFPSGRGTAILFVSTLRQITFYMLFMKKKKRQVQVHHSGGSQVYILKFTDISMCKLWLH